jgi:hypothetical protein
MGDLVCTELMVGQSVVKRIKPQIESIWTDFSGIEIGIPLDDRLITAKYFAAKSVHHSDWIECLTDQKLYRCLLKIHDSCDFGVYDWKSASRSRF